MTRRVVCFSGPDGAGMREVARTIADTLGLTLVDEEIVQQAAASAGVEPDVVADVERRHSFMQRTLELLSTGADVSALALAGAGGAHSADVRGSAELRELIGKAIEETADRGDVAIVAHAASHALGARPGVLRVLVTASPEIRAARLAAEQGLSEKEAARATETSDAARADYLRRFYDARREPPTDYDLVVNTDRLTAAQVAALVAAAAGR